MPSGNPSDDVHYPLTVNKEQQPMRGQVSADFIPPAAYSGQRKQGINSDSFQEAPGNAQKMNPLTLDRKSISNQDVDNHRNNFKRASDVYLNNLKALCDSLKKENNSIKVDFKRKISDARLDSLEALKSTYEKGTAEIEEQKITSEQTHTLNSQLISENDVLKNEVISLKNQLENREQEIVSLKNKLDNKDQEIVNLKGKIDKIVNVLKEFTAKCDSLKSHVNSIYDESKNCSKLCCNCVKALKEYSEKREKKIMFETGFAPCLNQLDDYSQSLRKLVLESQTSNLVSTCPQNVSAICSASSLSNVSNEQSSNMLILDSANSMLISQKSMQSLDKLKLIDDKKFDTEMDEIVKDNNSGLIKAFNNILEYFRRDTDIQNGIPGEKLFCVQSSFPCWELSQNVSSMIDFQKLQPLVNKPVCPWSATFIVVAVGLNVVISSYLFK